MQIVVIAAALPMIIACTNDNDNLSDEPTGQTVEFVASFDASTKTTVDIGTGAVTWNVGDKIWVNGTQSAVATNPDGVSALVDGDTEARFVVSNLTLNAGTGPYDCLYGANATVSSYSDTNHAYTITLPNTQTYLANGVAPGTTLSAAYKADQWTPSRTTPITFRNLCGIVKATLKGNRSGVRYVRLMANESISGTATVTVNDPTVTPSTLSVTNVSTQTTKYVQLDFGSSNLKNLSTPVTVYFVLPPNTYTAGVLISIYDTNGTALMRGRSTKTDLTVGRGEIIDLGEIDFSLIFAGSNIYWSTNHLTFTDENYKDETNTTISNSKYYQGVYFRYGGLVGITPAGDFDASTTTLYLPSNPATPSTSTTWSTSTPTAQGWSAYHQIPCINNVQSGYNYNNREYDHIGTTFTANYQGDICRFITETGHAPGWSGTYATSTKWRMPVAIEFGNDASEYTRTPSSGGFGTISANALGTTQITSGLNRNNLTPMPFFPAAGERSANTGQTLGNVMRYYSATISSAYAYALYYEATVPILYPGQAGIYNEVAMIQSSVRCVKN